MLAWCIMLFLLGVAAALDSVFNYGEIFRRVNSHLFMLVSLGLLVRTAVRSRELRKEKHLDSKAESTGQSEERKTEREHSPVSAT